MATFLKTSRVVSAGYLHLPLSVHPITGKKLKTPIVAVIPQRSVDNDDPSYIYLLDKVTSMFIFDPVEYLEAQNTPKVFRIAIRRNGSIAVITTDPSGEMIDISLPAAALDAIGKITNWLDASAKKLGEIGEYLQQTELELILSRVIQGGSDVPMTLEQAHAGVQRLADTVNLGLQTGFRDLAFTAMAPNMLTGSDSTHDPFSSLRLKLKSAAVDETTDDPGAHLKDAGIPEETLSKLDEAGVDLDAVESVPVDTTVLSSLTKPVSTAKPASTDPKIVKTGTTVDTKAARTSGKGNDTF